MNEIEERAHQAWESGRLKVAFDLFSKCAELGSKGCMLDLGYFYDEGLGTAVDKQQAMWWYKKAYRLGCGASASNIAILYREQGKLRYSAQWFQRSALLGDGDSEVELAKLYISGRGVRKSLTAAKKYLKRALRSSSITPAGAEEAEELLAKVQSGF